MENKTRVIVVKNRSKAKLIRSDLAKAKKIEEIQKKAKLQCVSPTEMLFNALIISATELSRLKALSEKNELTPQEMRKYQIIINSIAKLHEMQNNEQQRSRLDQLSADEKIVLVLQAIKTLTEGTKQ